MVNLTLCVDVISHFITRYFRSVFAKIVREDLILLEASSTSSDWMLITDVTRK